MIITSNLQQHAWQFSQVMPEAVFDEAVVSSDSVEDDSVRTVISMALMVIVIIIFINVET
jgi:uncharacterized DUF497 family protein